MKARSNDIFDGKNVRASWSGCVYLWVVFGDKYIGNIKNRYRGTVCCGARWRVMAAVMTPSST